jgi:DNA-binding transcriptional LysR family regulator
MGRKHLDLMDLRIFEAIMSERNVSRAADRLDLTQSVVSKGLGHLRTIFKDPLFIRSATGMSPTNRAIEISQGVSHSISLLQNILADQPTFDPSLAQVAFTIGVSDYGSAILLPELVKTIAASAPHITLHTKTINNSTAEELLLSGQVDLCLASDARSTYPIHYSELFRDHYVCLARAGHPLESSPFTADAFVKHKHIVMLRQSGGMLGVVDQVLETLGKRREVSFIVASLLSVPEILAETDLLMTTPSRIAAKLQRQANLVVHPHPLSLGEMRFTQLWHERNERNASHQWLRQKVNACVAGLV